MGSSTSIHTYTHIYIPSPDNRLTSPTPTTTNPPHPQEEARLLTGIKLSSELLSLSKLQQAGEALLQLGVGVVAITLGEHGAYVKATGSERRLQESEHLAWQAAAWAGQETLLPPYPLQAGAEANTNGAGDAFIAGLVAAMLCRTRKLSLKQATSFALLAARCVVVWWWC